MASIGENGAGSTPEVRLKVDVKGSYTPFARGDILIAKITPCFQNRKFCLTLDLPTAYGLATTEVHVVRPTTKVLPEFLFHFLMRADVVGLLKQSLKGSAGQQRVPPQALKALKVPCPPLSEQQRIVAEIELKQAETAHLRTAYAEQSAEVAALGAAAVTETFGIPHSPVTYGSTLRPSFVRLSDVAKLETGHTPSRKRPDWWGGEVCWLALPDIRAVDGKRVIETLERTNDEGLRNSSARILPEGSVAFSRTASVGFVTILGREMAVSQDFAVWVCGPDLVPDYLMSALRLSRSHLLRASSGAIHKTIYMDDLKTFQVYLPPVVEQRRIVQKLESLNHELGRTSTAVRQQLNDLAALDQAILREAFA